MYCMYLNFKIKKFYFFKQFKKLQVVNSRSLKESKLNLLLINYKIVKL